MTVAILERLDARIAAFPSIVNMQTLQDDLQEARELIASSEAQIHSLSESLQVALTAPAVTLGIHAPNVSEVVELLKEALERHSVNAMSTVRDRVERALSLLE